MKAWINRSRKRVYDQSPWLVVEQHEVELPDGRVIPDWTWIITPDYVNVIACIQDHKFIMFRQTKYGIPGPTLAPVGGYIMPGEEPLAAARRELREETGFEAGKWIDLGHFLVDPNRGIANGNLYLALDAKKVCEPASDDLEEQEILFYSVAELEKALDQGEIKILAWAAAVAFALRYLSKSQTK